MATWYFVESNQQSGPVDDAEFARLVSQGRIQAATLVWNETMTNWVPYAQMRAASVQRQAEALATGTAAGTPGAGLAPLRAAAAGTDATAPEAIHCAGCGQSFPADEVIPINGQWICAGCKPLALQKLREGVDSPTTRRYAGFWIRFAAKLIDGAALFLVNLLVGLCIQGAFAALGTATNDASVTASFVGMGVTLLVQLLIGLGYTVFFLGRFAATPGKMACGLVVVRPDGSVLTYGRAAGRHFADLLSSLTLCIGYLIAAFDLEKRALHDHLCDTRVVYR